MTTKNLAVTSAILLCVLLTGTCFAQGNGTLASIKKVYIGSMGQSDEAERFRLLLADELGKAHFAITDDANTADAVLTGALSVRVYSEESLARVTVVMKTPGGMRLWGKDFEPRLRLGRRADTVTMRAQDVAKSLRKDVDRAAKGT